jgi:hypothetical protein
MGQCLSKYKVPKQVIRLSDIQERAKMIVKIDNQDYMLEKQGIYQTLRLLNWPNGDENLSEPTGKLKSINVETADAQTNPAYSPPLGDKAGRASINQVDGQRGEHGYWVL